MNRMVSVPEWVTWAPGIMGALLILGTALLRIIPWALRKRDERRKKAEYAARGQGAPIGFNTEGNPLPAWLAVIQDGSVVMFVANEGIRAVLLSSPEYTHTFREVTPAEASHPFPLPAALQADIVGRPVLHYVMAQQPVRVDWPPSGEVEVLPEWRPISYEDLKDVLAYIEADRMRNIALAIEARDWRRIIEGGP